MRDKRQKFVELTEARVNRAIRDVRLIGNLSNRNSYEYTPDDVKKIFRALQRELDSAKARFTEDGSDRGNTFTLGED